MRILNLYAGIGGNRKLWADTHEVTAVELCPKIAAVYQDLFPNDIVVVGDAGEYLRTNVHNFDFIWLSPPCPTHSKLRLALKNDLVFPDLGLYEKIIFLNHFAKCKFSVENVVPYYEPLIKPTARIDRHLFWANFEIPPFEIKTEWRTGKVANEKLLLEEKFGFDLSKYKGIDKRKVLRNCVVPELGQHILNAIY